MSQLLLSSRPSFLCLSDKEVQLGNAGEIGKTEMEQNDDRVSSMGNGQTLSKHIPLGYLILRSFCAFQLIAKQIILSTDMHINVDMWKCN